MNLEKNQVYKNYDFTDKKNIDLKEYIVCR